MGRPVARWNTWGKWLSGIVVLCFFLPFFGISCEADGQKMDVLHFSGVDMAAGLAPGGLLVDAANESEGKGAGRHGGISIDKKIENVDVEPLAIVALAAALIVFGAAWPKKKGARAVALAFSLVALGALGGLFATVTGKLDDKIAEQNKAEKAGVLQKDVKITSGTKFGLWIVGFGLLGVAALAGSAVKKGEDDPPIPVATLPGGLPPAA